MSRKRTAVAAALAFLCLLGPAHAMPGLSAKFAACTGQLSAELEFQWLFSDPNSERTETRRNAMASLLDTVATADNRAILMAARVDAKQAHAMLLNRATFNSDADDAAWARQRAVDQIASCTGFLLV